MQNVTGNVSSVTRSVSRNKFSSATRRCQQFRFNAALRSTADDAKTPRFRGVMTNLWCKNKSTATSTTGIVKMLCNFYATSAHTKHAGNFSVTLYCFDLQFKKWLFSVLKIRVSVVRFRDWPPVIQYKTPYKCVRRFALCVCECATTLQQRCFNFVLPLFNFAGCV